MTTVWIINTTTITKLIFYCIYHRITLQKHTKQTQYFLTRCITVSIGYRHIMRLWFSFKFQCSIYTQHMNKRVLWLFSETTLTKESSQFILPLCTSIPCINSNYWAPEIYLFTLACKIFEQFSWNWRVLPSCKTVVQQYIQTFKMQ